jgi:phosphate starvation-inducible PhoH-like protein
MSRAPRAREGEIIERALALSDPACAQALFGPLHRHLALIQEAFRAEDGAGAHLVHVDARGTDVLLRAHEGARAELERAERIIEALADLYKRRRKLREEDVAAAIAFSAPGEAMPRELQVFGGLTLSRPAQLRYVAAMRDPDIDLVFGVGPAGTGKTVLAVISAVEALRQEQVKRVIVTRPAVEAGERLGFLPGDLAEKVDPYLQPIWDALRSQLGEANLKARRERREIEVAPLAFMRGRTLSDAFVIVDEAQNATPLQMKMVLTRLGAGSRMVVTGDPSQTDLPSAGQSGLLHALSLLEGLAGIETVRFSAQDVVRHRLVARIIEAYDGDERRRRRAERENG